VGFTGALANGSPIGSFPQVDQINMVSNGGALEASTSALSAAENFTITDVPVTHHRRR